MPLTDTAIRKTKPEEKPIKLRDGGGLYLILRPDGARWWRLDYRRPLSGKRNTLSLGTYPDTGLAEARAERDRARKQLAAGIDPGEHRKADEQPALLLADAEQEIRNPAHTGQYDALQVDLYDHEAAAPVLDSAAFYADCRAALNDEGCLTVNLFGRDASYERSVESIRAAFGADAIWAFKPTRDGNAIVLAQRTPSHPTRMELLARAEVVQERWGLPAVKWMKLFKPVA